eukprot:GFUD01029899.1.p2 GENE.GFUD01029899.1~~GFUD01029899.1.p2  ORF type:complete len:103 (+),score=39.52 GFUD01029899.1:42-350(+)
MKSSGIQTPKSGKRSKFGSIKKRPYKSFEQRIKIKEEQMKTKELAKLLLERELREKIEENKKRQETNSSAETFQIIKDTSKIKKMKKKQLKSLTKKDIVTMK